MPVAISFQFFQLFDLMQLFVTLYVRHLLSSSIFFTDEPDGVRPSGFRFPGQNVRFAVKLPRYSTAISVEEWLPSSYGVNTDLLYFFSINGILMEYFCAQCLVLCHVLLLFFVCFISATNANC